MLTQSQLADLAREYHQLHNQRAGHGGQAGESAAHRRQGQKMARVAERFERLLRQQVSDQALVEAWRRHLYHSAPAPSGPELAEPPADRREVNTVNSSPAPAAIVSSALDGARLHTCVIAADSARARIFLLATDESDVASTLMPLTEVADLVQPEGRARDSEVLTEERPPLRADMAAGPGSGHAVSDHRENRRHRVTREFAESIAEAASRVWSTLPGCRIAVVASPAMLGLLRPALAGLNSGPAPRQVRELARDLSKLAPAALHDALADAGLVPARGRREPRPRWQRDAAESAPGDG